MEISQFFINGDIKGAIAYMREHEEFKDIPQFLKTANTAAMTYRMRSTTFCACIRYISVMSFISACLSLRPRTSC